MAQFIPPLPPPPNFTFTRHSLSKYFPDTFQRSYVEGARLNITGSSPITANLNFSYVALLRKIAVLSSGSFDGDFFNISGSNRTDSNGNTIPYATNILSSPAKTGLVITLELGETFTGSNNNIWLSYFPTGSSFNQVYCYFHLLRN